MSPSRGLTVEESTSPSTSSPPSSKSQSLTPTELTAQHRSSSALQSLTRNISYLLSPSSPTSPTPARFRTRALLRALHSVSIYIFWRVVRYAKYAIVGSVIAALSATTIGGFATGIGWVVAPTGVMGVLGMSMLWWVGKWGFGKTGVGKRWERRMRVGKGDEADGLEKEEREDGGARKERVRVDGQLRDVTGPKAVPW
ncbi:hypothetical protein SBOR_5438 [Sclerotinia borealis F-4128]|uniref:Uncharacterized protein n=1 Tax=Sclerotinia borealis (strain F-4128) TaxID=1432307 RepID=W9CHY1_SCLBF|nr:hypothetical protein SBOR_5438 [Sclerotinia borealis F-4128]